jgi:hypothetical protein
MLKSFSDNYTATTYSKSGLLAETSYYYRVKAYNGAGISTSYDSIISTITLSAPDTTPPSVPELMSPMNNGLMNNDSVTFNWNKSTDAGSGMSGYEIEVSTFSDLSVLNSSSTVAHPTDQYMTMVMCSFNLSIDGNYYWHVRAKDNAGNYSAWTSTRSFQRVVPPAKPTNFRYVEVTTNTIKWAWDDNASTEDSYKVKSCGGMSETLATLSANTTSWLETGLTPNTSYWRNVEAYRNAGAEAFAMYLDTREPAN